jgi:hypothetical protein
MSLLKGAYELIIRLVKADGSAINVADSGLPVISPAATVVFHNAVIDPVDGAVFVVGNHKTLSIEIYGTSSSRTVEFLAIDFSGTARPLVGIKTSDVALPLGIGTTGTGERWQFDITGLASAIMRLAAVAGGNVTIKGKAVA